MDERQRLELVRIFGRDIEFDCSMMEHTTFRVGGHAEALCICDELDEIQRLLAYLSKENIPYFLVGRGSNVLVKDSGFKGVVMKLHGTLAAVQEEETELPMLIGGGGLNIVEMLSYCKEKGLGGVEFLAGIPGTLGGAVAMNAGAWGKDMGTVVQEIHCVTRKGDLMVRDRSHLRFSYRALSIPEGAVIVKTKLGLHRESREIVSRRMTDYLSRRKERQPLEYPSAGSVFKNPPNGFAGRLIEEAGLKGKRIGGAMVSPKHANFIVNTGEARAEDILALMDLIRQKVMERSGIELEPEIRVVG
jgi:UDP-N-acetylmuramate dehydrogenase